MHLFDQTPSDASAQPQRPLLYKPDDNDNPGACADFGSLGASPDCEPYHQTPVPRHRQDHGSRRQQPQRAMRCVHRCGQNPVRPHVQPVDRGEHCFFVEPSHSLELRVNVDRDNPPGDYGKRTDLWTDRQETTINGKPAATFWDTHRKDFDIYLSPYNDLTRRGNLHIHVEAMQGRGDGARTDIKLDPAKADLAKQVIAQVTQKHFGG